MKTALSLLLGALFIAGCSSTPDRPSFGKSMLDRFNPLKAKEAAAPAKAGPPKKITRAQIEEFNVAMVRANLQGESVAPLMIARSVNKGYASYLSRSGQSITLRGALVTSTRGLGTDLLSVEHAPDDPLSKPTRASNWPSTTSRAYFVPGPGLTGTRIAVDCTVKRIKDHDIKIAETPFKTTQMTEICKTDTGVSFVNHHFVDRSTGQIWVTQQWVGPDMAPLGLEVLEPIG